VLFSEYSSPEIQAKALAAIVAGQLALGLAHKGHATLAVPGGTTPRLFLKLLSQAAIDWANVSVMPTDERCVPEDSERSNARLLRDLLLQGPAAEAELIPLFTPDETDPAAVVAAHLPLDVCVLGMGADKHIASLFPEGDTLARALDPSCPDVSMTLNAPATTEPRVTLTAPVLRAAKHVHLLITGEDKLAAFEAASHLGDWHDAPVRAILTLTGEVTVHYSAKASHP